MPQSTAQAAPTTPRRSKLNAERPADGAVSETYFRELERESLMRPEEERDAATRILEGRERYWAELLSYVPLHGGILAVLEDTLSAEKLACLGLETARSEVFGRRGVSASHPAVVALAGKLSDADPSCDAADIILAEVQALARGRNEGGRLKLRAAQRSSSRFVEFARAVERARLRLNTARSTLARANLRLVVSMAHRYRRSGRMTLDDLIQEGNVGLLTAVDRFDPRRGFRFSTYGSWWIRHAISRALSDRGRAVRLPVHVIELQSKLATVRREFSQTHGREPDIDELVALTGVAQEKIERFGRVLLERDMPRESAADGSRPTGVDALADVSPGADHHLEAVELDDALGEALETLRPMEAEILRLRFGLDGGPGMTLRQVGEVYSLSRERIRQIQQRALDKLKTSLQDGGLEAMSLDAPSSLAN